MGQYSIVISDCSVFTVHLLILCDFGINSGLLDQPHHHHPEREPLVPNYQKSIHRVARYIFICLPTLFYLHSALCIPRIAKPLPAVAFYAL